MTPHAVSTQPLSCKKLWDAFWVVRKPKEPDREPRKIKAGQKASIQGPTCYPRACPADSGLFAQWICHPVLSGLQATHCSRKTAAASGERSAFGCDNLGKLVFSMRHRPSCHKEGGSHSGQGISFPLLLKQITTNSAASNDTICCHSSVGQQSNTGLQMATG